jgi:ABC-type glucose/galactose transport system permease subunit
MDLVTLLVVLVVVGLVWWLVTTYVPLPPAIKTVATVIAVLLLCIWLLDWVGLTHLSVHRRG